MNARYYYLMPSKNIFLYFLLLAFDNLQKFHRLYRMIECFTVSNRNKFNYQMRSWQLKRFMIPIQTWYYLQPPRRQVCLVSLLETLYKYLPQSVVYLDYLNQRTLSKTSCYCMIKIFSNIFEQDLILFEPLIILPHLS